jgi:hypothetical protein
MGMSSSLSAQQPNAGASSAGKASHPPSPMQMMAGMVRNYGPQNIAQAQNAMQQAPQVSQARFPMRGRINNTPY